jgi:hypothetical protein
MHFVNIGGVQLIEEKLRIDQYMIGLRIVRMLSDTWQLD